MWTRSVLLPHVRKGGLTCRRQRLPLHLGLVVDNYTTRSSDNQHQVVSSIPVRNKSTVAAAVVVDESTRQTSIGVQEEPQRWIVDRKPIVAYNKTPTRTVPRHIRRPPYANTGQVPVTAMDDSIMLHNATSIQVMKEAAQLAATVLLEACNMAMYPGTTTNEIDIAVHELLCNANAYPSPLNYCGFPKSVCTSVNEVICHGIPDTRPLQYGDVVSFDVSCFLNGVHGDNCATIIVGDYYNSHDNNNVIHQNNNGSSSIIPTLATETVHENSSNNKALCDWRGVPYRTEFVTDACREHFMAARRLVTATREALYAAIETVKPGSCLSEIGNACQTVADSYGYSSVTKYRGHGIHEIFHAPPYIQHYRNIDLLALRPGMIFTIEPMLCQHSAECYEWSDKWTVVTKDGGLSAQFEHTVLVTETGVEILTLPPLSRRQQ